MVCRPARVSVIRDIAAIRSSDRCRPSAWGARTAVTSPQSIPPFAVSRLRPHGGVGHHIQDTRQPQDFVAFLPFFRDILGARVLKLVLPRDVPMSVPARGPPQNHTWTVESPITTTDPGRITRYEDLLHTVVDT